MHSPPVPSPNCKKKPEDTEGGDHEAEHKPQSGGQSQRTSKSPAAHSISLMTAWNRVPRRHKYFLLRAPTPNSPVHRPRKLVHATGAISPRSCICSDHHAHDTEPRTVRHKASPHGNCASRGATNNKYPTTHLYDNTTSAEGVYGDIQEYPGTNTSNLVRYTNAPTYSHE